MSDPSPETLKPCPFWQQIDEPIGAATHDCPLAVFRALIFEGLVEDYFARATPEVQAEAFWLALERDRKRALERVTWMP